MLHLDGNMARKTRRGGCGNGGKGMKDSLSLGNVLWLRMIGLVL